MRHGTALLVSDLHLSPDAPATTGRFLRFLAGPARRADTLFILGDLFDAWAGDDDLAAPFNAAIVAALNGLADAGTAVFFMPGNRDFLVGDAFAAAAGLTLLPDPCVRAIGDGPTLLTHGDTLCTDDADYQRFRATVRTPAWRENFLGQPLAERKTAIAALRAASETEKQNKPMPLMEVNETAVAALLQEYGVRDLIHGHTHRQGRHTHLVAGRTCRRWVLGDWHAERSSVLACTAAGWDFLH